MSRLFIRFWLILCVFTSFGCLPAFAQNGQISGQVSDPQGGAVPDATVRVLNQDSKGIVQVKTDAAGMYSVPFLPAGRYQVVVQADGFRMATSKDINLSSGQTFLFNVQLTVAAVNDKVAVEGTASVATVETETAAAVP
jgi:hypothetical protein